MQDLLRRYGTGLTLIMCLLVAFWLLMLVIVLLPSVKNKREEAFVDD